MSITYYINSYKTETVIGDEDDIIAGPIEIVTDERKEAKVGDGRVAIDLFDHLVQSNPDRGYAISATAPSRLSEAEAKAFLERIGQADEDPSDVEDLVFIINAENGIVDEYNFHIRLTDHPYYNKALAGLGLVEFTETEE